MNISQQPTRRTLSTTISILLIAASFAMATSAEARRWAIGDNKQLVEAKVVDFNSQQVLFRTGKQELITVQVEDLSDDDLAYLTNLAHIRQMEIARQQLRWQKLQNLSRYFDVWEVELIAPNGERIVRPYLARSNADAILNARSDFPVAEIGYVKKIRRNDFPF
jgi:hypothetical protein